MILTTALTGVAVIVVLESDRFFALGLPVEWMQLVALLIGLFALVCAWGHTLLALKVAPPPPIDLQPESEKCNAEDITSREQHLTETYLKATSGLLDTVKEKQHNLTLAYEELTMSAWFLGMVAVIAMGLQILNDA